MLVVAHENRAAFAQPSEGSFDDPPSRLASPRRARSGWLADRLNVRFVPAPGDRCAARGIVEAFVQAEMLLFVVGTRDDCRVEQIFQARRVVPVGRMNHRGQRPALAADVETFLRAVFAAIRRVAADVGPPKRALPSIASAACHFHSTPPSSSQCSIKIAHNRSNMPSLVQV